MVDKSHFGIRSIDLMPQKGRTVMIYGMPGRGKTTLINTLKGNVLLINADCGEQVLNPNNPSNKIEVCSLVSKNLGTPAKAIQKLKEFIKWLDDQPELPWDYIVVDNISEIENLMLASITERRADKIKAPDQNAYGEAGFDILNVLKTMRNLTYKNVNVIYIAWEKTEKITDFGGEIHSEKGPMLVGQTQLKISGLVDFIMAMRVEKKGERYLQLDSDHKYMAKKRTLPGTELPNTIECPLESDNTLQTFFDLIKHGKST